ncbi:hypothetical protein D3C76_1017910 [compost metagenome]
MGKALFVGDHHQRIGNDTLARKRHGTTTPRVFPWNIDKSYKHRKERLPTGQELIVGSRIRSGIAQAEDQRELITIDQDLRCIYRLRQTIGTRYLHGAHPWPFLRFETDHRAALMVGDGHRIHQARAITAPGHGDVRQDFVGQVAQRQFNQCDLIRRVGNQGGVDGPDVVGHTLADFTKHLRLTLYRRFGQALHDMLGRTAAGRLVTVRGQRAQANNGLGIQPAAGGQSADADHRIQGDQIPHHRHRWVEIKDALQHLPYPPLHHFSQFARCRITNQAQIFRGQIGG